MIKKVLALFIFCDLCLIAQTARAVDWYDCCSWGYRKKITIDYTKVSTSDLSYFAVLINTTDVAWKDTSNGGHVGQSDGGDILFTSSNGVTKLDHEIEKYTATTGELVAWVEVPTVSASANTVIYIYYGNATCADQWNINGTWNEGGTASIKGVWHLKEDPSGTAPQIIDSTSYANNGTSAGSMTTGDQVPGQIGGSLDFDGSNDDIAIPDATCFDIYTNLTISVWVKWTKTVDATQQMVVARSTNWRFGAQPGSSLWAFFAPSPYPGWVPISGTALSQNAWHYMVFTYTGATSTIYKDGSSWIEQSATGNLGVDQGIYFGGWTASTYFGGIADEIRIYNRALGLGEITTTHNNQSSPSTFYSVSSEETMGDFFLLFE